MIDKRELLALQSRWLLSADVIQKDYVLGWLLAGISQHPVLGREWVFKGGTCLRKCYFETFRFSEDLDFTATRDAPHDPAELEVLFGEVATWLYEESGIELIVDERSFTSRRNLRGKPTLQGRVAYSGPNPAPTLPKVKIDVTADELLAMPPTQRPITHLYSDQPLPTRGVLAYTAVELMAEKLRALGQRCRPRDLYDVVHMHRHPDLIGQAPAIRRVLAAKSEYAGIDAPTLASVQNSPFRTEIESEWANMLGHQLPAPLPPFHQFWAALDDVFGWLDGTTRFAALPPATDNLADPDWSTTRAITSWRGGLHLEILRYSAANRLKVAIDYRAKDGRAGPRIVEPYALRRSRQGDLLLYVVNDIGRLRSYRVDRIAAIRPTGIPFTPRYRMEL